jgi:hypothetical protein
MLSSPAHHSRILSDVRRGGGRVSRKNFIPQKIPQSFLIEFKGSITNTISHLLSTMSLTVGRNFFNGSTTIKQLIHRIVWLHSI